MLKSSIITQTEGVTLLKKLVLLDKMKIEEMELYTVLECAKLLKSSDKTIRRLIRKGNLRALDIGAGSRNVYRIPASELELFLKKAATSKSL